MGVDVAVCRVPSCPGWSLPGAGCWDGVLLLGWGLAAGMWSGCWNEGMAVGVGAGYWDGGWLLGQGEAGCWGGRLAAGMESWCWDWAGDSWVLCSDFFLLF